MDNNDRSVPYMVFEDAEVRAERRDKRKSIIIALLIIIIFLQSAIFTWAWTQYDYTSSEVTYTQDGEGTNLIGSGNEVVYGTEISHKSANPN